MNAGFRPGSRTTLVSAKVVKAIDAPFGLIRLIGREAGRRAKSRGSNKPVKNKSVRSGGRTAGVGKGKRGLEVGRGHSHQRTHAGESLSIH